MKLNESITTTVTLTKEQQQIIYIIKERLKQSIFNGNDLLTRPPNADNVAHLISVSMEAFDNLESFLEYVYPYHEIDFFKELESIKNAVTRVSMESSNSGLINSADSLVETLTEWERSLNEVNGTI